MSEQPGGGADTDGAKFADFVQDTTFHGVRFIFTPGGSVFRRLVCLILAVFHQFFHQYI